MPRIFKPERRLPNGEFWRSKTYYYEFYDHTGKQQRGNTNKQGKKEAQQILDALVGKTTNIKLGLTKPEQEPLEHEIKSLVDLYLSEVKLTSAEATHYERDSVLNTLLLSDKPLIPNVRTPDDITPDKVNRWMSSHFESELKHRTDSIPKSLDDSQRESYLATQKERIKGNLNKQLAYLQIFLNWCVNRGKILANPIRKVKKLSWMQTSRGFTAQEEKDLINASTGTARAVLIFLADTGLRLNEMDKLKWSHVDLENNSILVEHSAVKRTKSKKSRIVYLTSRAKEELEKLDKSTEYVFASAFDGGNKLTVLRRYIKKLAKQIGIRDHWNVNVHSLRKSYATAALTATNDIAAVQHSLGHSQPTLVLKIYHQLNDGHLKNLASALDKVKSDKVKSKK